MNEAKSHRPKPTKPDIICRERTCAAEDPKQTVFESVVAAFVGCFFVGFDALVPAVTFKSSEVIKQPVHKHIFYHVFDPDTNR